MKVITKQGSTKQGDYTYYAEITQVGDDDYIIADMVFREYTYGEDGTEPFCNVNALNRDFGELRLKEIIKL